MSIQKREIENALLDGIRTDLEVLCERCQRDCKSIFILTVPYYSVEFNRILEKGQKAQLEFFKDTLQIELSHVMLNDPKIDNEKYGLAVLHSIEASASKLLARIVRIQNEIKGKPETTLGSTERPKAIIAQDWKTIEKESGITKTGFGRKINFVSEKNKREVLFRDVEHAYALASSGFSKPAVILAGGVIEELLRLYLKEKGVKPNKDDFNAYILACEKANLLKSGISRLSDSVRHFRNLVHLSKEKTKKHAISKSIAVGAVASIFTIANDF